MGFYPVRDLSGEHGSHALTEPLKLTEIFAGAPCSYIFMIFAIHFSCQYKDDFLYILVNIHFI